MYSEAQLYPLFSLAFMRLVFKVYDFYFYALWVERLKGYYIIEKYDIFIQIFAWTSCPIIFLFFQNQMPLHLL